MNTVLEKDTDSASMAGGKDEKIIEFDHKFFSTVKDPYFRLSDLQDEALMVITLADKEALLPIEGIKREFDLDEESHDGQMLDLVEEALSYVGVLRIGAPLPAEVLTGEASWEVSERHKTIAYQRITMQLVSWLSGEEEATLDPEELALLSEKPEVKEKVNQAFAEAATELGLGADQTEMVLSLIMTLAEELSHIVALSERFERIRGILEKATRLRQMYAGEKSVMENLDPVVRLLTVAIKKYQGHFDQVDAQTGEIMAVLKNIGAQTKFIQGTRNKLYRHLFVWENLFNSWEKLSVERSRDAEDLVRETYRFLAQRFMPADKWILLFQLQEAEDMKTAMQW